AAPQAACRAKLPRQKHRRRPRRDALALAHKKSQWEDRMKPLSTAVSLALLAAVASAQAQSYPTRPVTIIVPYPAGGPTDQVARQIAPKLAAKLGQSFVVENVSGGGTNIAGQRVARSAPDGTMLFIHNLQISANVALY